MIFKRRKIFAVETGAYAGEMWIFCKKKDDKYQFLSIPIMENRCIEKELFYNGLEGGALKFVEKIPRYVYNIAVKQFMQNEKTLNN
jgi:hypothetical protein